MKWMIASDIHGSGYYCAAMLEAFEREAADRLLLLGDLLYHGPRNDLPRDYDPRAVAERLNAVRDRLFCVRGNCDAEVDQMMLRFPIRAEYALLWEGSRLVFAVHGHAMGEEDPPALQTGDILLQGHTHVPCCREHEGFICMNPGSVSLPKEGSWRGYMTMEDGVFLWKDLEGAERLRWAAER